MKVSELRDLLNELPMEYDGADVQIETTFTHCKPTELRMVRKTALVVILSEHWLQPRVPETIKTFDGTEYETNESSRFRSITGRR
jgi:hypothetical protein